MHLFFPLKPLNAISELINRGGGLNRFSFFFQVNAAAFFRIRGIYIQTERQLRIIVEGERMVEFSLIGVEVVIDVLGHQKGVVSTGAVAFFFDVGYRNEYGLFLIHDPTVHRFLVSSVKIGQPIFILNIVEDYIFLGFVAHNAKIRRFSFHPVKTFNQRVVREGIDQLKLAAGDVKNTDLFGDRSCYSIGVAGVPLNPDSVQLITVDIVTGGHFVALADVEQF